MTPIKAKQILRFSFKFGMKMSTGGRQVFWNSCNVIMFEASPADNIVPKHAGVDVCGLSENMK